MKSIIHKILRFIKQEMILYPYFYMKNNRIRKVSPRVDIKSIEETIDTIIKKRVSMSRYGDGEFSWMMGIKQNTFQDYSVKMRDRLIEIISSSTENHIVCLSDAFGSLKMYNRFAKRFWSEFMINHRMDWIQFLDSNKPYYNTNVTRLYMDYKDKSLAKKRFDYIKKIWDKQDIVIVEGEKTRLGVGNDLFENAKNIQRILAPATNAFNRYEEILCEVKKVDKQSLILIALGPTATILAYDLAKEGFWALDVGHVDIEYEWCLMGAKTKVPVQNKYVNEAAKIGGTNINNSTDSKYLSEITVKLY
ncbi:SP_1767 family glycosyltransferase [Anaerosporobacter sp.]